MPEPVLVAVAHGSTDPRARVAVTRLAGLIQDAAAARWRRPPQVRTAFLGHAAPSLGQVLAALPAGQPATVVPLLLTAAYHVNTDIPRVLSAARPRSAAAVTAALGPHPLLLRAAARRLAEAAPEADPARTAVVLAAAGSSDPAASNAVAGLAARWQAESGWLAVRPAYAAGPASGAGPSPAAAVAGLLRAGAGQVLVASYLLAPGVFADRIARAATAAGAAAVSAPLGACPEVADVALDRFCQASAGHRTAA